MTTKANTVHADTQTRPQDKGPLYQQVMRNFPPSTVRTDALRRILVKLRRALSIPQIDHTDEIPSEKRKSNAQLVESLGSMRGFAGKVVITKEPPREDGS